MLHVAGSKGKGSTALLAEQVLRAAGERVGTFTSPHLEHWTERFRIDGAPVEGERLARAVEALRPHVDALRAGESRRVPTFFDATTAAALWLFADAGVDRAILEVGLGGRLDSTNAVEPAVTCITTIELEHTDKLGDSLGAVAGEKAGILKPGRPAVVGVLAPEAERVVLARAREVGAPVSQLGRDFHAEVLDEASDGLRVRLRDGALDCQVTLPVLGRHQAGNAALAVACAARLAPRDPGTWPEQVARGLAAAVLPGRIEVLGHEPWIAVDGAHTGASARALATVLGQLEPAPLHLVLSISSGKDVPAILEALLPHASRVTVTRAEPTRSLAPAEVAAAVRAVDADVALRVVPNPHLALRAAREALGPGERLCVTGSVYLAGIARRLLGGG